jgi:hypoxanthine phosphoribosyltransferase
MAVKAGIVSILGIPVMLNGSAIGSLRVYAKENREFTNQDISFVNAMANITALAFSHNQPDIEQEAAEAGLAMIPERPTALQQARSVDFAHSSEEEFARVLDFYDIEWVYEPRSFALAWDGDRVTEMFTPDFYLPHLDLYIEITTLKQRLITQKNRKLRRLKELHPDIKIMLLQKNDYDRLLAKYGYGPLSHTRAHGISRVLYPAEQIDKKVRQLSKQIAKDYKDLRPIMVGVQRGFICFMADLIRQVTIPVDIDFITISYYSAQDHSMVKITKDMDLNITGRHVIMVEDIVDTGMTLSCVINHLQSRNPASLAVCTLLDKRVRRISDVSLDYIGFEIPDEFVVGYGLDYREEYRNLPFIGVPEIGECETSKSKPRKKKQPEE